MAARTGWSRRACNSTPGRATPRPPRGDALTASLADALRRALDGFVGLWGTVTVQQVRLDSERATYDPDTPARLWRRSQDYLIWYGLFK